MRVAVWFAVMTAVVAVLAAAFRVRPVLTAVGIELIVAIVACLFLAAHAPSDL